MASAKDARKWQEQLKGMLMALELEPRPLTISQAECRRRNLPEPVFQTFSDRRGKSRINHCDAHN